MDGDGDFRSAEVCKLRDEADIIVTNPPFSLFREFFAWIIKGKKKFVIIASNQSPTYKDVFSEIKKNRVWYGNGFERGNAFFRVLEKREYAGGVYDEKTGLVKFRNCIWLTNIDHGKRHEPLQLMTMADNIKYSKHNEIRGHGYVRYDNYDAIEVKYADAIPIDYEGIMGVSVTFLEKYCPEQFEIVGNETDLGLSKGRGYVNGKRLAGRIFIRKIKNYEERT